MADKRAYFKLDVGYLTNPKVAAVMDESATAIVLHVGSIAYCAQHLTDGEVPVGLLLRLTGASKKDAALLLAAGLWTAGDNDGLAHVHDYLEHQRSAADVKGASEAGKRGASARWNADRNADGNADRMQSAMPVASESAMPREKEREKEISASATSSPSARRKAASRLPDDWSPTEQHWEKRHDGIDVETEAKKFRLHAEANDRRQVSWNAAFSQWLLNARPSATVHPMRPPGEGPDDWMRRRL